MAPAAASEQHEPREVEALVPEKVAAVLAEQSSSKKMLERLVQLEGSDTEELRAADEQWMRAVTAQQTQLTQKHEQLQQELQRLKSEGSSSKTEIETMSSKIAEIESEQKQLKAVTWTG